MLARGPHAYTALVGREWADVGYCASKKLYFHGLRLHLIAQRRAGTLPRPQQLWLREASCAQVRSVKEQVVRVPQPTLLGDRAYADAAWQAQLAAQGTQLVTPRKKLKGQELSNIQRHYNRCVSRLRQPVESWFRWCHHHAELQDACTVRSTDGLLIHCFGKLAFAFLLLLFNP